MLLLCHKKYKILSFLPFLLSLLPEILNALMICDILLGEEIIIERGVSDGLLIFLQVYLIHQNQKFGYLKRLTI